MREKHQSTQSTPRRRTLAKHIPAEGEGGLFTQSWYPICESSQLEGGKILGTPFLDGRVVAFRGESGVAHVMSAYCPHLGADLAQGAVIGDTVRCGFHHWRFDESGRCTQTGTGDPPPPTACVFKFPTVERYGVVWAFNGEAPLFDLPSFPYPDDELVFKAEPLGQTIHVDPWVVCCNVPDVHHLETLHGIDFEGGAPSDHFEWNAHSVMYDFEGSMPGSGTFRARYGAVGTSMFYMSGTFADRWFGLLLGYGLPAPGKTEVHIIAVARGADGDAAANGAFLDSVIAFERSVIAQDIGILDTIRFQPGTLTPSDRALVRFFEHLRSFPRAHPSADFI